MVKPHSPIAECKRSPELHRDDHKVTESMPNCSSSGTTFIRSRKQTKDVGDYSPRKVTSDRQLRTKVSFSRIVNVKQVLHKNDMSEKVRERYWLTEKEHAEIKNHCRQTILKMMRNDEEVDAEDSDFCSRGLEMRTKLGQHAKRMRKEAARRAVLLQQQLQQEEGIVDAEFIAVISSVKTRPSYDTAREAAMRDADESRLYLCSDS